MDEIIKAFGNLNIDFEQIPTDKTDPSYSFVPFKSTAEFYSCSECEAHLSMSSECLARLTLDWSSEECYLLFEKTSAIAGTLNEGVLTLQCGQC